MKRAAAILQMHDYFIDEDAVEYLTLKDSLFRKEITSEELNTSTDSDEEKERNKNIGTYIMMDTICDILIRAGSTAKSFGDRVLAFTRKRRRRLPSDHTGVKRANRWDRRGLNC